MKNPNNDTTIEQTPGYSLPQNSTLLQEWPSGTSPNLRGVTILGNVIPPGTYYIYLDAVNQNGRVTRVFTIQIESANTGGGGGGGGGNDEQVGL